MKKIIFLVLAFFAVTAASGQTLQKFFDKYADDERFQYVSINNGLMNMASVLGGVAKEEKKMMSKMQNMKILTLEGDSESSFVKSVFNELNTIVENGNFETIVEVREKGERVNIFYRIVGENNADMLIITKEKGEFTCIWIKGKMTREEMMNSISSNQFEIDELSMLN